MLMVNQTGGMMGGNSAITYTQSSNITTGGNIYTLMGSPAGAGDYVFVVASGVSISSNSTGTPGLQTGAFPAGSTLTVVNNGNIYGMGGAGGAGGVPGGPGSAGSAGGNAMSLGMNVSIDNTNGNIFGGGGGGGGGGVGGIASGCCFVPTNGSGGGGGASGLTNSSGGSGANAGSAGTSSGAGSGGPSGGNGAGAGGAGGTWGATGTTGSTSTSTEAPPAWKPGGSGGAAGKAVNLNGFSVTWLGGNNATQVKGAVS